MKKINFFYSLLTFIAIVHPIRCMKKSVDLLGKPIFCKHFNREIESVIISPDHMHLLLKLSRIKLKSRKVMLIYWPESKCKEQEVIYKNFIAKFCNLYYTIEPLNLKKTQFEDLTKPINKKQVEKIKKNSRNLSYSFKNLILNYTQDDTLRKKKSMVLSCKNDQRELKKIKIFKDPTPTRGYFSLDGRFLKIHYGDSIKIYDIINDKFVLQLKNDKNQNYIFRFLHPNYFLICKNYKEKKKKKKNQTKNWIKIFNNKKLVSKSFKDKIFTDKKLTDLIIKTTE